jgi:lipopolysaccharide transport system ATP-binding protein
MARAPCLWGLGPPSIAELDRVTDLHRLTAINLGVIFPIRGFKGDAKAAEPNFVRSRSGRITGYRALDGVSFDLRGGDVGLIGANGAGKSSLLSVLAGTRVPDSGAVEMTGRATSLININIGIQQNATGHRNITLRGLVAGKSRDEIEERRGWIAEFSELGAFLDMPFNTYSAGMRMRLNLRLRRPSPPEILLMDEWLSAGDARFRKKASARMHELVSGATILVFASHNRKMLEDTCSEALWLDHGRVRVHGPVGETFDAFEEAQRAERNR